MYSPQTRKRLQRGLSLLTAALIVLFCALDRSGRLDWLENRSSDWRAVATLDPAKADRDIVIIDIDNTSFREVTAALDQRWPWTRELWTELVRYIAPGHPKLVLFDILFSGVESERVDARFATTMKAAGNVILPFAFVRGEVETEEMYRVFNMGIGMVVIVSPEEAHALQSVLGEQTCIIGELVSGERKVTLA